MKTSFMKLAAIPFALFSLAAIHTACAQSNQPPPVKMGLWQTESHTTMSGMANTPMAGAAGQHSSVVQGCMTPETWKDDLEKMSNPNSDCQMTSLHQDATSITADMKCTSQRYTSTVHFQGVIEDEEHMHGSANMQMSVPGMAQTMSMQTTFISKHLSSDCGDVKPGHGKVISHQ
ncbi:MAG: DUF3617 domain-containing protein [Terracidiphilus sp.]